MTAYDPHAEIAALSRPSTRVAIHLWLGTVREESHVAEGKERGTLENVGEARGGKGERRDDHENAYERRAMLGGLRDSHPPST